MPDLPLVTLQRLVAELDEFQIPYAIIGGVAVSIRSVPRYTQDVDAVLWVGEYGWEELINQITRRGLKTRATDPVGFARQNRLLLLTDEDGVHIDLSFGALPFEEDMVRNAEPIEIGHGCVAAIATAEALVLMKAIAWRPKDKQDIREIVSLNPDLNWELVISTFSEYAELLEVPERVSELKSLIKESL